MPDPQTPGIGEDVTALMPPVGADVTDLMGAPSAPAPATPTPAPMFATRTTPADGLVDRAAAASSRVLGDTVTGGMRTLVDLNVGALKGAGNTVVGLSRLGTRLPGVKALMGRVYGLTPEQIDAQYAALDAALQPTNTAQALGRAGEQIAETIIPGRAITGAGVALASRLPRGLQTAGRMLVEGAGGASLAAVQGSDPAVAGGVSAAFPAAGALVRGGKRALGVAGGVAPEMTDAVDLAQRHGVPMDVATASGSKLTRAAQNLVGRGTIAGGLVREGFERQRGDAMARAARTLAEEASPEAVTPETAGQQVRNAIKAKVRQFYTEANEAYGRLRSIAERPENAYLVPRTPKEAARDVADEAIKNQLEDGADAMFRPSSNRPADLWNAVLADAKQHGYKGSPTTLRKAFDERMAQAQSLVDDMNQGNYGRQLLQYIADSGGIGKAEKDLQGEVERLWEMSGAARRMDGVLKKGGGVKKQQFNSSGALGGVAGVVRREGLTVDQMMERLRAHPEYGATFADLPDAALFELIDEAVDVADSIKIGPLDALAQLGVRPGQTWWQAPAEATEDAAEEVMALPVDLRPVKAGLRELYDEITELMPTGRQQYEPGLKALQNIMDADDFMPAVRLDKNLSAIKKLARGAGHGEQMAELRSPAQGAAAHAVQYLEDAVQRAIAQAGPEAVAARDAGRAATRAKAAAGDVLKRLREEPVQAFDQALYREDRGIKQLREVATLAPGEMPKIGRAFLEKLIEKATAKGGFGREQGLFTAWENLGPETKKLLYPNPRLRRDLDAFFRLAVKATEEPNTSSTSYQVLLGSQGLSILASPYTGDFTGALVQIPAGALAKLLYSPGGVRLLSEGLKVPTMPPAQAANVIAQLQRLGERAAVTTPAAVPSTPPSAHGAGAR